MCIGGPRSPVLGPINPIGGATPTNPVGSNPITNTPNPTPAPVIEVPKPTPAPSPVLADPGPIVEPTPPPVPIIAAAPSMIDPNPTETAGQRIKRLAALRMGIAKTIKTSPMGLPQSPLVSAPAAYSSGTKGLLGQ